MAVGGPAGWSCCTPPPWPSQLWFLLPWLQVSQNGGDVATVAADGHVPTGATGEFNRAPLQGVFAAGVTVGSVLVGVKWVHAVPPCKILSRRSHRCWL